ncbi:MAG: A/G-specific adenine glycosylase [Alphaproteobacteria bacterium]|nr:MAG: A/G-specific adenine glycosylase [Alphaproteobacteria bacterium]
MAKRRQTIDQKLLAWYDKNRRELPWRAAAGAVQNPYYVWVSEIMLQQTTVPAVMKYFPRFIHRFPTVTALAVANLDDVLTLWQGLGYYARARNLHKCAGVLVRDYGGEFPTTKKALMELPGIGDYTAGAIAAIAFDQSEYAVDANVERVIARLFAVRDPLPKSKPQIINHAAKLTPQKRAGDYLQAMMDLGAGLCSIDAPQCTVCPLTNNCMAREKNIAVGLPVKIKNKNKPVRYGQAFIVINDKKQIFLRKRAGKSMLGDMIEVPSSNWDHKSAEKKSSLSAPKGTGWDKLKSKVRHSFTHFDLELDLYVANMNRHPFDGGFWHNINKLDQVALPTLFKKTIRLGIGKI